MIALLDVNALVALAWPNHIHHEAAHAWFQNQKELGWATCSVTQSGFVRVSSNPATTPEAKTPGEALALLELMVTQPGHVFWNDDISLVSPAFVARAGVLGHRQVTDAHLLSLAIKRGGRLATFDRRLLGLVPEGATQERVIEVLGGEAAGNR